MRAIEVVRKVAPNAKSSYLDAFNEGDGLLKRFEITTPLRMSHFLAQVLHESGELTVTFENMNYRTFDVLKRTFGVGHHTAALTDSECKSLLGHPYELAERVYGLGNPKKARELGNTRIGDGYLFRGGGALQTTGGDNYLRMGKRCGVDFYGNPELVCSAEHALKPALAEWAEGNLNEFADKDDLIAISRAINIGDPNSKRMPNGYANRKDWYQKIRQILTSVEFSDSPVSIPVETQDDERDLGVEDLQKRLNELRVEGTPIDVDGDMGPKTVKAIKAFQKANDLDADGVVGPRTKAALDAAVVPSPVSPTQKSVGIASAIVAAVVAISTFVHDHAAFAIAAGAVVGIIGYLVWRRRP